MIRIHVVFVGQEGGAGSSRGGGRGRTKGRKRLERRHGGGEGRGNMALH